MSGSDDVDAELLAAAREVAGRAYVPYSRLRVGVAGRTTDGRVVVGCNVENASYGLTLCAECGLVSALAAGGGGRLETVVCVRGDTGALLAPCGRCRQLLAEHGSPRTVVNGVPLAQLLPGAFTAVDLPS